MMATVTVDAEECSACHHSKPRTEFYDSELKGTKRCKPCFRARIDAANKRNGRRSTSLSASEVEWLNALLRVLPTSELRDSARRPEYAKIARKIGAMARLNALRGSGK